MFAIVTPKYCLIHFIIATIPQNSGKNLYDAKTHALQLNVRMLSMALTYKDALLSRFVNHMMLLGIYYIRKSEALKYFYFTIIEIFESLKCMYVCT